MPLALTSSGTKTQGGRDICNPTPSALMGAARTATPAETRPHPTGQYCLSYAGIIMAISRAGRPLRFRPLRAIPATLDRKTLSIMTTMFNEESGVQERLM